MSNNTSNKTSLIWIPVIGTISREYQLALRTPSQWINPVFFFVMVIALFPMTLGPEPEKLGTVSVAAIWVAVTLSSMLSASTLFTRDFESGVLEQLCFVDAPLTLLLLVKVLMHWLFSILPLLIMTPLLSLFLFLPSEKTSLLMISLLLGTPSLVLVNAVGACITLMAGGGSVLLLLICLPLQIPVILFATGSVSTACLLQTCSSHFLFLTTLLIFFSLFAPFAMAFAVRVSVEAGS